MRAAPGRTGTGAFPRLGAVLMAAVALSAAGAAPAGAGAMPPLPPLEAAGEDTAAPAAEAAPGVAAGRDTRAKDTRAANTGAAEAAREPGASRTERAGSAPGGPEAESADRADGAERPASRLLRALAKPSGAERSAPGEGGTGAAPVYAVDGCPRALLRRLLAGAADENGALTALGIEREVLTLCRERQEIVVGLFRTEALLRELRAADEPPVSAGSAIAAVPASVPAPAQSTATRQAQPSPLRAALAAAGKADEADAHVADTRAADTRAADTRAADTRAADTRAVEGQGNSPGQGSSPVQAPRYAWFSIIGTAGALRAGISDGTGVWFVREGDALPGGAHVAAIAARPPAVRVSAAGGTDGETPLPYRARPGGGQ